MIKKTGSDAKQVECLLMWSFEFQSFPSPPTLVLSVVEWKWS
jgi:hypothetical protein